MADIQKRQRRAFSSTEKTMIWNMFSSFTNDTPSASHNDVCKSVALSLGVHWTSIYKVLQEQRLNNCLKPPKKTKKRLSICDKIDDFTKCVIRIVVHNFFLQNEIPTLDKILEKIKEDGMIQEFKRSTLQKVLKKIGFKFNKRGKNSLLTDRDEIFLWRRNYLRAVKLARHNGQKVYYLDETWLDEGHTSGKGERLIITHIGSEDGFVEGALHVVESKQQGDFHQEINADSFEDWFNSTLDKLDDNAVIVMDNASYHSRKKEKVPTTASTKEEIIDWLKEKNINFEENLYKRELVQIVKKNRKQYEACIVDEMARSKNKTVLRLPPYHCQLNPIELIWAQIKGNIASQNVTFKMVEIKQLLLLSIQKINADKWKKCIQHVTDVIEPKMDQMDHNFECLEERIIINGSDDGSDTSESE